MPCQGATIKAPSELVLLCLLQPLAWLTPDVLCFPSYGASDDRLNNQHCALQTVIYAVFLLRAKTRPCPASSRRLQCQVPAIWVYIALMCWNRAKFPLSVRQSVRSSSKAVGCNFSPVLSTCDAYSVLTCPAFRFSFSDVCENCSLPW